MNCPVIWIMPGTLVAGKEYEKIIDSVSGREPAIDGKFSSDKNK